MILGFAAVVVLLGGCKRQCIVSALTPLLMTAESSCTTTGLLAHCHAGIRGRCTNCMVAACWQCCHQRGSEPDWPRWRCHEASLAAAHAAEEIPIDLSRASGQQLLAEVGPWHFSCLHLNTLNMIALLRRVRCHSLCAIACAVGIKVDATCCAFESCLSDPALRGSSRQGCLIESLHGHHASIGLWHASSGL